ncbi:phosphotransferase family protein [Rhodococcus olei]|uniref:Phosphotransferase family protein n=1 Tax=Rhodococcus olei TaxID=2161675 RepID=A0ABP8NZA3_9NOCA
MTASDKNAAAGPAGLDISRLNGWLAPKLGVEPSALSYNLLTSGRSNLTYLIDYNGQHRWVLRRPPLGHPGHNSHDVLRESRIYNALTDTNVAVPAIVAQSDESGPLGAPMFVMEYVDGFTLDGPADFDEVPRADRKGIAISMMHTLADIHALDPDAVSLGDLKRPESLVDRQLRRWLANIDRLAQQRTLPSTDAELLRKIQAELSARRPAHASAESLCHGDFKPNNLIFRDSTVAAVLDWELAAVGDTGLDVGWLSVIWSHELTRKWAPRPDSGYPTADELVQAYQSRRVPVDDLEFYQALALWKLACIRADVNARLRAGAMADLDVQVAPDDDVIARLAHAAGDLLTA